MLDLPILELLAFFSRYIPEMMLALSLIICLILTPSLTRARAIDLSLSIFLVLTLGVSGISGFISNAFYPVGDFPTPFEWQVAIMHLALGIGGLMAFKQSFAFRLAVIINATCFLWGTAAFHLYECLTLPIVNASAAGLYPNIIVPGLFWLLIACRSHK